MDEKECEECSWALEENGECENCESMRVEFCTICQMNTTISEATPLGTCMCL